MFVSRQVFEGEILIFEGDHSPKIYLVKSGQFKATKKIKDAAGYFDIKIIDHIIVSEEGFYSFADEGIL